MATNVHRVQGEWNYLRDLAKQRWTQLTDDDLPALEGNIEDLVGLIQQKTGDGREAIERFFAEMTSRGSSAITGAAGTAGRYVHQVSDQVRERYDSAEALVRLHPTKTVIAALGIGLVVGLFVGLASRPR